MSKRATAQLDANEQPVFADMELFFSCMIRKRLVFSAIIPDRAVKVSEKLFIGFHPPRAL